MHKTKVIDWILSGMNYNQGINLLLEITGDKNSATTFTGKENSKTASWAELEKIMG